jgi:hypothetical protein
MSPSTAMTMAAKKIFTSRRKTEIFSAMFKACIGAAG